MARRWPEHSRRVSRSTTLRVIRLLSRELRQQVLRLPPSLVLQEQRAPQVLPGQVVRLEELRAVQVAAREAPAQLLLARMAARSWTPMRRRVSRYVLARVQQQWQPPVLRLAQLL